MGPFKVEISQNDTATTTSQRTLLGDGPNIMLIGEGAETVYVKFGDVTVVATNEDVPILSGAMIVFEKTGAYMAFLAAANTSRLGIVTGRQGV